MLRHINDFSDDENLKVNIIMKDGVEFFFFWVLIFGERR